MPDSQKVFVDTSLITDGNVVNFEDGNVYKSNVYNEMQQNIYSEIKKRDVEKTVKINMATNRFRYCIFDPLINTDYLDMEQSTNVEFDKNSLTIKPINESQEAVVWTKAFSIDQQLERFMYRLYLDGTNISDSVRVYMDGDENNIHKDSLLFYEDIGQEFQFRMTLPGGSDSRLNYFLLLLDYIPDS